jgi:lipopolysaccharide/colanic/teichoic acid biosynthesis glycosyltransferase/NDP-sugar pyrophosphorylase family protein
MAREAVILAGGRHGFEEWGAAGCPKLLLPIANRSLVEYTATALVNAGVARVLVVLDEERQQLKTALAAQLQDYPLEVRVVAQPLTLGTAGSLRGLRGDLGHEPFWVISGDLFLQTNLVEMLKFHRDRETLATVAVFRTQEPAWEMERVEVDHEQRVKAIHRFHQAQDKRSSLRPLGLYLFDPAVLEAIPPDSYFDLKEQLLPVLRQRGNPAVAWESSGYGRVLVSVADYLAVNRDVLLGRVPVQAGPTGSGARQCGGTMSASDATIVPPVVLDPTSSVGRGVTIVGPTAVGAHAEIGEKACLVECVVFPSARIGRGAQLTRCILGEGSVVGEGEVLRDVIASDSPIKFEDGSLASGRRAFLDMHGLMVAPRAEARRGYFVLKRALDVTLSALFLLLVAPLLPAIALAVWLDVPGPLIFRQRRCGLHGKEFTMLKFRTMVDGAEDLKRTLVNDVDGPMFKMTHDPRVTRVGRFLRASNLDELPQLWNVLRGDMSLVGPRPLAMEEMQFNPRWRDIRLSIKPGLTGLWQVKAHSRMSFVEWIRNDIRYVRNLSTWQDLKILVATLRFPVRFR